MEDSKNRNRDLARSFSENKNASSGTENRIASVLLRCANTGILWARGGVEEMTKHGLAWLNRRHAGKIIMRARHANMIHDRMDESWDGSLDKVKMHGVHFF